MKEKTISGQNPSQTQPASNDIQSKDPNSSTAVARRSFIKGLGVVGATLLPGAALLKAQSSSSGKLSKSDADLLRFALWANSWRAIFGPNTTNSAERPHRMTGP